MLRHAADRRTVAYLGLTTALVAVNWYLGRLHPVLYPLQLFMFFTAADISDNHNHVSIWKAHWDNLITSWDISLFYGHPAIADVQVIGVPDAHYGEELCAWVRLRPGHTLTLEALREHCRGKIAHYKIPHYLRITGEFPMTVTGKVQKYRMREISVAELGLQAKS